MTITKVPADVVFRIFTACQGDPATLILDVRHLKEFKKKHIAGAYSIRLASNHKALLDYSKNTYDLAWSTDCWWDKHVVIYGEPKLKKDHPVVTFLAEDKHAKSVNIYTEGLDEFEKAYPFLVTASTKANARRRYPGEIVPGLLYLGDWDHAQAAESLGELGIKRILTIHNNPENLKPSSKFKWLKLVLADVETEDVTKYFASSYTFIEEARVAKEGVLVHCGAGVSRSAAVCIAYLMRKYTWPAAKARAHCKQRRSVVEPNDGFWRSLCAFESQLGIQHRSDPTAVSGFAGVDAPAKLSEDAAGEKVTVAFVPFHKLAQTSKDGSADGARRSNGAAEPSRGIDGRSESTHDSNRQRSRVPDRRDAAMWRKRDRSRSRSRDKRRGGSRERHTRGSRPERSRSPDRHRKEKKRSITPGPESIQQEAAPVVLESIKEGKVLGRLNIGLKSADQRCVFGRLPSSEVVLEHLSISRQHAHLSLDAAGDLFITDLGSAHRTNVDGVWIRPSQPRALAKGAVFKLGGSTREFKVVRTPRELAKERAAEKAAEETKQAIAASGD